MTTRTRLLLAVAAACVLAWPAAAAEPLERVRRIGYLSPFSASDPQAQRSLAILRQTFRELGAVEGQGGAIESRWAQGRYERLPVVAADLFQAKVDIIITVGGLPSAQAAEQATKTIPLVVTGTVDPVEAGLVASLGRPRGNITGSTIVAKALLAKHPELLTEAVPDLRRLAVLAKPGNPSHSLVTDRVTTAARSWGLQVDILEARGPDEFDRAFATMANQRVPVVVVSDAMFILNRTKLAALEARNTLPSMHAFREDVETEALMSYGPSLTEIWQRGALYVDRILKGAQPGDLPVEQPSTFELVIHAKMARALGLTIPPSLLARADEVIE